MVFGAGIKHRACGYTYHNLATKQHPAQNQKDNLTAYTASNHPNPIIHPHTWTELQATGQRRSVHDPHIAQAQSSARSHQDERHNLLLDCRGGRQHKAVAMAVKGEDRRGLALTRHAVNQQAAFRAEV